MKDYRGYESYDLIEEINRLNKELSSARCEINSLKHDVAWSLEFSNDDTPLLYAGDHECPQHLIDDIKHTVVPRQELKGNTNGDEEMSCY